MQNDFIKGFYSIGNKLTHLAIVKHVRNVNNASHVTQNVRVMSECCIFGRRQILEPINPQAAFIRSTNTSIADCRRMSVFGVCLEFISLIDNFFLQNSFKLL